MSEQYKYSSRAYYGNEIAEDKFFLIKKYQPNLFILILNYIILFLLFIIFTAFISFGFAMALHPYEGIAFLKEIISLTK